MRTIYKFQIPVWDEVTITMPKGAELLHVAVQDGVSCVWAIVEPGAPKVGRLLHIRGTGHPLYGSDGKPYVGTVHLHAGALVFHIFDGGEVPF